MWHYIKSSNSNQSHDIHRSQLDDVFNLDQFQANYANQQLLLLRLQAKYGFIQVITLKLSAHSCLLIFQLKLGFRC